MKRIAWWLGFGQAFVQTDVPNPIENDYLYTYAKVRPRWWWKCCKIKLFLLLVWRRYESERLSISTAWEVAGLYDKGLTKREKP